MCQFLTGELSFLSVINIGNPVNNTGVSANASVTSQGTRGAGPAKEVKPVQFKPFNVCNVQQAHLKVRQVRDGVGGRCVPMAAEPACPGSCTNRASL